MKKTKDWPAYVERTKADLAGKRGSLDGRVLGLNEQIDDLKKQREKITKVAMAGFVGGELSQTRYTAEIAKAEKLFVELRSLIEARDELVKESQGMIEQAEAKLVPEIVASINEVSKEVRTSLENFTAMFVEVLAQAERLDKLQDARSDMHRMAKTITKSRVDLRTLGLQVDNELDRVLSVGTNIRRFNNLVAWTLREAEKEGGLFGVHLPELLNAPPPQAPVKKKSKPSAKTTALDAHLAGPATL